LLIKDILASGKTSSESFFHFFPIDNLPDLLEELRSGILVVKVISMLPNVHVEKGNMSSWADSILITRCHNLKLLCLLTVAKPGPS